MIFSFLYIFKRVFRSGKPNLPPSPPKLPIIGNLHQLGTLPHCSLRALSKKYGPVMLLYLAHAPTLVVSSAELAKEVLQKNDTIFASRPQNTVAKILLYGYTDMGFAPYGQYWRQVRKICVLELLSLKRVESFQHIREEEVASLTNKVRESCSKQTSVNLTEMIIVASNNIVSRCTLGQKFEEEDGKRSFGHLARRVMVQLTAFCFGDFFPYLGWLNVLTRFIPSLKATFKELDTFFDQVIEEHKIVKSNDDEGTTHILLQLQRDGMLGFEFTDDNLKAILLDMFVAGIDTTSTTLEWLLAKLIKNPSIMKRAQDEVRTMVGKKSKIDVNIKMHYLKCIVNESLRLNPPAPLLLPRETSTSVILGGGYDIPPKTKVFVNIWALQRDPSVWERPEEFLPKRFIDNPIDF
ncbi:hypothetical protein CIPAW_11G018200 [Carya illinoinensis]|uniref:Cytochrome P450 n=1 Tax=Carya illinoinensis TaxID=32201 RepID=A0A8T1NSG0_CARIL|nr:hypothetical protein CIPAW_11G018200 [Carya illinoinensis]